MGMIDTLKIISPPLEDYKAELIKQELIKKMAIDCKTGEQLYEITTGFLEGSFDHRLSLRVQDIKGRKNSVTELLTKLDKQYEGEQELIIEGSIHKNILGHNVYGGTEDIFGCCICLITAVEQLIGIRLPCVEHWKVSRVDYAEIFILPSYEAVSDYIKGFNVSAYPRRKVVKYGQESVCCMGRTTTLNFYHKGPEYYKHDRTRLKNILEFDKLNEIQEQANKTLRVEIQIKAPKLRYDFNGLPLIPEVTVLYLKRLYELEVKKFLKEGIKTMSVVRDSLEVERRLYSAYKPQLAGLLMGFWYRLSTMGEEHCRKQIPKTTYYRQLNQLKAVGCSWLGTDVILYEKSECPRDFIPLKRNEFCINKTAPLVSQKISIEKYYYQMRQAS